MSRLALRAPLSGVVVPLDEVPDPVFAQRLVGDGVSIAPSSSTLLAPCDGRVAHLHGARHAITITTSDGIEVMMHIGLDTVTLRGEGFTARVAEGDAVTTGQPLIEFDAPAIAAHARSLVTQVVITNSERVAALTPRSGLVVAGRDILAEVEVLDAASPAAHVAGSARESDPIRIASPHGLHGRPAAVLARAARAFASDATVVADDGRTASARSVVGLMAMDLARDDRVRLRAVGADADRALATLVPLLASGLQRDAAPEGATQATAEDGSVPPGVGEAMTLVGVSASPGVAVGRVWRVAAEPIALHERGTDAHAERDALDTALDRARAQVREVSRRLDAHADAGQAEVFAMHEALLDEPDMIEAARAGIASGQSAAWAWSRAVEAQSARLEGLGNAVLAARAHDLRDVGRRVLRLLTGAPDVRLEAPAGAILVAEELAPSDIAAIDRTRVVGCCTTLGGATSHVAILARALDLPAVMAIDPRALEVTDGTPAILDGGAGVLRLHPSAAELAAVRARQERQAARRATDLANASQPAVTTDGRRIEVVANIGTTAEAGQVVALGGEGVGLLRTEFLFLDRITAPTEDEQAEAYASVARRLGPGRRLVIRTLDAGGDKPLAYALTPRDPNPFLGERGLRLQLTRPDLLRTQLRAILRASRDGHVHVLFPMVATLGEWRSAKAMLDAEREHLGVPAIPAGIMVEVPSAAIMADAFAREADFLSIGTNDLAQHTLAMDRGHPALARQVDALNPAVLQLVAHTVASAHAHARRAGVCGGLADDAQAIPILVGLGVDELSVSVPSLPAVKAQVRGLDHGACRDLAARALAAATAADVRALVARP